VGYRREYQMRLKEIVGSSASVVDEVRFAEDEITEVLVRVARKYGKSLDEVIEDLERVKQRQSERLGGDSRPFF